jgi:hypothetical protein
MSDHDEEDIGKVEGLSPVQYHIWNCSLQDSLQDNRLCLQRIADVFTAAPHELPLPLQTLTPSLVAQLIAWDSSPLLWLRPNCACIDNTELLNRFFEAHLAKVRDWCSSASDMSVLAHGSDFLRKLNACRRMMRTLLTDYVFYHVHLNFEDGEVAVEMDALLYQDRTGKAACVSLSVDPNTGALTSAGFAASDPGGRP